VSTITLLESTSDPRIDNLLCGVISLIEMLFPGRARGYLLHGSYTDGSAVPDSDIDITAIFSGTVTPSEREKFHEVIAHLSLSSPLRLDAGLFAESRASQWVSTGVKHGLLIYGEHTLKNAPLEPSENRLRRSMQGAFHHIYLLRQRAENLVYPLAYPDATGEYYGYERWGKFFGGREFGPGVRTPVTAVTLMASTLLAMRGQQAVSKQHSVELYREHIGGEWAELIEAVYTTCKMEWEYRLPQTEDERKLFQSLCRQILPFENEFLRQCRPCLLADLQQEEASIRQSALQTLNRVSYTDAEFTAVLQTIKNAESE
jgi:predicted nucleotidyltransferase